MWYMMPLCYNERFHWTDRLDWTDLIYILYDINRTIYIYYTCIDYDIEYIIKIIINCLLITTAINVYRPAIDMLYVLMSNNLMI